MRLAAGLRTRWGNLSAPPDPLAAIGAGVPTSKGVGREGMGKGKKGGGKEGKGRWEGEGGKGGLAMYAFL